MAVCLSLHGIVSGFQSQTQVSILIPTAISVIHYASLLKDMEFMRPRKTVWVNSPTSLPSLFPVHSSALPFIPYQSNYRPHMITGSLLLIYDTGTNTSITGRCTDISHGLCMMELLPILIPTYRMFQTLTAANLWGHLKGIAFLQSAGMQDKLWQQYGICLDFFSIFGTLGIAGFCYTFKVMESIWSNICIHFVNLKCCCVLL